MSRKDIIKKSLGITEYPWSSDDDLEGAPPPAPTYEATSGRSSESHPTVDNIPGTSGQTSLPIQQVQGQWQQAAMSRRNQDRSDREIYWSVINGNNPYNLNAAQSSGERHNNVPASHMSRAAHMPAPELRGRGRRHTPSDIHRIIAFKQFTSKFSALRQASAVSGLLLGPGVIVPSEADSIRFHRSSQYLRDNTRHSSGSSRTGNPGVIVPSEANSSVRFNRASQFRRYLRPSTHLSSGSSRTAGGSRYLATHGGRASTNTSQAAQEVHEGAGGSRYCAANGSRASTNTSQAAQEVHEDAGGSHHPHNGLANTNTSQAAQEVNTDAGGSHRLANTNTSQAAQEVNGDAGESHHSRSGRADTNGPSAAQEVHEDVINNNPLPSTSAHVISDEDSQEPSDAEDVSMDGCVDEDVIDLPDDLALRRMECGQADLTKKTEPTSQTISHGVKRDRTESNEIKEQVTVKEFNEKLLRLLECPVCLEWMEPPMSQCRRGHLVCANCRDRLNSCPVCRTAFSSVRNRAMEGVAEMVRYPCRHGCGREVRLRRRAPHEASCAARKYVCPAPPCAADGRQLPRDQLAEHFQSPRQEVGEDSPQVQGQSLPSGRFRASIAEVLLPPEPRNRDDNALKKVIDRPTRPRGTAIRRGKLNINSEMFKQLLVPGLPGGRPMSDGQDRARIPRQQSYGANMPFLEALRRRAVNIANQPNAAPNEQNLPVSNDDAPPVNAGAQMMPQQNDEQLPNAALQQLANPFVGQQRLPNPLFGQQRLPNPLFGQHQLPNPLFGQQQLPNLLFGQQRLPNPLFEQHHLPNPLVGQHQLPNPVVRQQQLPNPLIGQRPLPNPFVGQPQLPDPLVEQPQLPDPLVEQPQLPDPLVEQPQLPDPLVEQPQMGSQPLMLARIHGPDIPIPNELLHHLPNPDLPFNYEEYYAAVLRIRNENKHLPIIKLGCRHKFPMKVNAEQHNNWFILAMDEYFHLKIDVDIRTWGVVVYVSYIGPKCNANNYTYEVSVEGQDSSRQLRYRRATHCDLENCTLNVSRQDCFHLTLDQALNFIRCKNKHCESEKLNINVEIAKAETVAPGDDSNS